MKELKINRRPYTFTRIARVLKDATGTLNGVVHAFLVPNRMGQNEGVQVRCVRTRKGDDKIEVSILHHFEGSKYSKKVGQKMFPASTSFVETVAYAAGINAKYLMGGFEFKTPKVKGTKATPVAPTPVPVKEKEVPCWENVQAPWTETFPQTGNHRILWKKRGTGRGTQHMVTYTSERGILEDSFGNKDEAQKGFDHFMFLAIRRETDAVVAASQKETVSRKAPFKVRMEWERNFPLTDLSEDKKVLERNARIEREDAKKREEVYLLSVNDAIKAELERRDEVKVPAYVKAIHKANGWDKKPEPTTPTINNYPRVTASMNMMKFALGRIK